MMNYRTVLRDFSPIEWGDFLMRFEINQRSYVLFSPEHGKVSCLELMYFTELDPLQLSVLLGIKVESEPVDRLPVRREGRRGFRQAEACFRMEGLSDDGRSP